MNLVQAKKALRRRAAERRAVLAPSLRTEAALRVRDHVIESVPIAPGAVVSGYWPYREELDVRPALHHLHGVGHPCGLPVVVARDRPLAFRVWTPETVLVNGVYGIPVPPADAGELTPGLMLVPLLAFDRRGHRLGHGAGYYDRTLSCLRAAAEVTAVGVAFSVQEVDDVPHHDYDQRLDWIVTEEGAWKIDR